MVTGSDSGALRAVIVGCTGAVNFDCRCRGRICCVAIGNG